jgi:general stress protein YciG
MSVATSVRDEHAVWPATNLRFPGLEDAMAKEDRGFASMDRNKRRDIASKGGKAAHERGTAHEWTSDEAREAGRKGGMVSHQRQQEQLREESAPENTPSV